MQTERLLLRRWKETDRDQFHKINSDPAAMEFLPKLLTREESDSMIVRIEEHFEQNGFNWWTNLEGMFSKG